MIKSKDLGYYHGNLDRNILVNLVKTILMGWDNLYKKINKFILVNGVRELNMVKEKLFNKMDDNNMCNFEIINK